MVSKDTKNKVLPELSFKTVLLKIKSKTIIKLPGNISSQLPSRGIVLIEGTINEHPFKVVLEPDGIGSHWFTVDSQICRQIRLSAGDTANLKIKTAKDWPEPDVPQDFVNALKAIPQAYNTWVETTPMARWDWLRWIQSTQNEQTRKRRIDTACDKLKKGERRPCCFNRNMCTVPEVSKGGILIKADGHKKLNQDL